jgi:hypothetical protein
MTFSWTTPFTIGKAWPENEPCYGRTHFHFRSLYSLRDDPREAHDLAAAQPERAAQPRARLHAWWQDVGAQLPQPNPGYRAK